MMFHVVGGTVVWHNNWVVGWDSLFKRNLSAVIKNVSWCSVIVKHLWWLCADKLHHQFQKINSRHCRVSEREWNYWPPLMFYLKVNLWNLKMCTATVFEKRGTTHAWKIFQGKVNIWNEKSVTEWLNGQIEWDCIQIGANYTNSAYIYKFTKRFKKQNFFGPTFLRNFQLKKSDLVGIFKNVWTGFYCTLFLIRLVQLISILLQHHISKLSRYFLSTFWSVQI
jgi:hypothetical protein